MEGAQFKKAVAVALVVVLSLFVLYALLPYVNALFGALILYILFRPVYGWLTKRGLPGSLSGVIVILLSLLIIIIPISFSVGLLVEEIGNVLESREVVLGKLESLSSTLLKFDLEDFFGKYISAAGELASNFLVSTVKGVGSFVVGMIITYFVLYYLLVSKDLSKKVLSLIPFNKKNSMRLEKEFANVTYAVVISTGLIAVLQGFLLTIGFLFFGIPAAVLWGFVAAVLSFLPVVGPSIVWIPAGIISLLMKDYFAGIGILVWGVIISNMDNFLRPMIQKQVGRMHPLISLIGVFIGIPIFGILGLIIGPLLLSYFFLTMRMFKEEYLSD